MEDKTGDKTGYISYPDRVRGRSGSDDGYATDDTEIVTNSDGDDGDYGPMPSTEGLFEWCREKWGRGQARDGKGFISTK